MKKKLCLILGGASGVSLAWLFLMTLPVLADGGPHRSSVVAGSVRTGCASCHRAHTAQAPELLKQEQPTLCYSCHGDVATGSEGNVQGGFIAETDTAGVTTMHALRGGGFEKAMINTKVASASGWATDPDAALAGGGTIPVLDYTARVASTSAHQVSTASSVTIWGNGSAGTGTSVTLTCGNCHDPHGNGGYRILRPIPKGAETGDPTVAAVVIPDGKVYDYATTDYWDVGTEEFDDPLTTDVVEPDQFIENVSAWCTTCHTRYLTDESAHPGRTASGDPIFQYRHQTVSAVEYGPTCIQCHVAHGSPANMRTSSRDRSGQVPLPGETVGVDPTTALRSVAQGGDSRLLRLDARGVCQMCHYR